MILADKIINERKKNGWSQEELAEQLNVSRQSVSKWESAQSIPDLQKIIKMAEIFGVTTDYLLKDEIEAEDISSHMIETADDPANQRVRRVSMEEANAYMEFWKNSRNTSSNAVTLCILSPTVLLGMGALAEKYPEKISENLAGGIGLLFMFALLAIAIVLFIKHGARHDRFKYIESEPIETEYGVSSVVKEKKKAYEKTHTMMIAVGVTLCICCAVPIFICMLLEAEDFLIAASVVFVLIIVSVGVNILIRTAAVWESYEALLEENVFTKYNKDMENPEKAIMGIYWTIVTTIFLGYSFITNNWQYSWIIWMLAGVLSPAIKSIVKLATRNNR